MYTIFGNIRNRYFKKVFYPGLLATYFEYCQKQYSEYVFKYLYFMIIKIFGIYKIKIVPILNVFQILFLYLYVLGIYTRFQ